MARLKRNIIPAAAIVAFVASLVLRYQARAGLREHDEQVQRLRERMAQLEADVGGFPPPTRMDYRLTSWKHTYLSRTRSSTRRPARVTDGFATSLGISRSREN